VAVVGQVFLVLERKDRAALAVAVAVAILAQGMLELQTPVAVVVGLERTTRERLAETAVLVL
jgi:hypothetical protein